MSDEQRSAGHHSATDASESRRGTPRTAQEPSSGSQCHSGGPAAPSALRRECDDCGREIAPYTPHWSVSDGMAFLCSACVEGNDG